MLKVNAKKKLCLLYFLKKIVYLGNDGLLGPFTAELLHQLLQVIGGRLPASTQRVQAKR